MRKFLIKIAVLGAILMASMLFVFYQADGTSDPFYKKFTTTKQSSLFLGSSRVAQGVIPTVINNYLENIKGYNYAFTYNTSAYGLTYLNSIKQKLDTTATNQVFILGVNPWVLTNDGEDPNDPNLFLEKDECLGTLTQVNAKPNLDYLVNNFSGHYIKLLYNNALFDLEDDGFLRLRKPLTDAQIKDKSNKAITSFKRLSKAYQFSETRLSYLKQTIAYLKPYGTVYMLRMPIGSSFLNLENEFMPNFDKVVTDVSSEMEVSYLNFTTENFNFKYVDGHHLLPESANILSLELAKKIKQINQ